LAAGLERPRPADRNPGLEFRESVETDTRCWADGFRLRQVFRNVFENALDASPEPIRISVRCRGEVAGRRRNLRVSVRDNGPGLSPEQRRNMFEPFFTTKVKGTGLGMAIAHRILEAHGGRIGAGEAGGEGAEIVIVLPGDRT